jgi:hypothetical protein
MTGSVLVPNFPARSLDPIRLNSEGESMGKLTMAICFASMALGQQVDRVFQLKNATTVIGRQEIATALRQLAHVEEPSIDNAAGTLTVKGTVDQLALTEWLVPRLDVAEASDPGPQEYRVSGDTDDVVVVLGLVHTTTIYGIQEICATLRSVANIRTLAPVVISRIITLRDSASQIALAESLLPKMDLVAQPRQEPSIDEFKLTGSDDIVMVYGLAHTDGAMSIQEIMADLRSVLDIPKIFPVTAPNLLVIRCRANQLQMVKWLIPELDRQTASPSGNEAHVPGSNDDVVHVFYMSHATNRSVLNNLVTEIHRTAHIMKAYARTTPPTLVVRGTEAQIATAAQMIELADRESQ